MNDYLKKGLLYCAVSHNCTFFGFYPLPYIFGKAPVAPYIYYVILIHIYAIYQSCVSYSEIGNALLYLYFTKMGSQLLYCYFFKLKFVTVTATLPLLYSYQCLERFKVVEGNKVFVKKRYSYVNDFIHQNHYLHLLFEPHFISFHLDLKLP